MSQGSFVVDATTVDFLRVAPNRVPPLNSLFRQQHTIGTNGSQYINLGSEGASFSLSVDCEGEWDNGSTATPFDTLNSLQQQEGTLTLHGVSTPNIVLVQSDIVEEICKAASGGKKIARQTLQLQFIRLV